MRSGNKYVRNNVFKNAVELIKMNELDAHVCVCVNLGETTWVYSIIRLDKTLNHMYRKENDLCIFPIQYKHNTKVMKDKEAEKLR